MKQRLALHFAWVSLAFLLAAGPGLALDVGVATDNDAVAVDAGAVRLGLDDATTLVDPVTRAAFSLGDLALQADGAPPPGDDSSPVAGQADPSTTGTAAGVVSGPSTQDAATAATVATGLALLAALAAYNWGSLSTGAAGLLMPLFSRIQSHHMLDNEVRNRVHEAVEQNPGVTIKEITMLCSIGWGTAVYHLKRLEGERLVVSERNRQFRRFFKNGGGIVNASKAAFGELKNATGHRIAKSIVASPGSCQKELCEAVGISPPLAHKYLARLEHAGLVESQREWKTVKYYPTPQLQDLLLMAQMPEHGVVLASAPVAGAVAA